MAVFFGSTAAAGKAATSKVASNASITSPVSTDVGIWEEDQTVSACIEGVPMTFDRDSSSGRAVYDALNHGKPLYVYPDGSYSNSSWTLELVWYPYPHLERVYGTLVSIAASCGTPSVYVAPPSNVHLIYSGGYNDNTKVEPVAEEISFLTDTSNHYDIGGWVMGASANGTNTFCVAGGCVLSQQDLNSGGYVFSGSFMTEDGTMVTFANTTFPSGATANALVEQVAGADGTGFRPIYVKKS